MRCIYLLHIKFSNIHRTVVVINTLIVMLSIMVAFFIQMSFQYLKLTIKYCTNTFDPNKLVNTIV